MATQPLKCGRFSGKSKVLKGGQEISLAGLAHQNAIEGHGFPFKAYGLGWGTRGFSRVLPCTVVSAD